MEMSFKEKGAWISLISTLAIFGYYFYNIALLFGAEPEFAKEQAKDLLVQAIILSIVVEAVFHSLLAAANHKDADLGPDERDNLFKYRANSLAYNVLVFGVVATLGRIIIIEYNPQFEDHASSMQIPLLTAHILMFSFILSEIVRFAGQIFYYRRGY